MIKSITFLTTTILFFLQFSYGQLIKDINSSVPSPSAATLGLFTEMPVSLFTGLPSIEISLYELKEGNLSVPVKLSYHASGFRPDVRPGFIAPNWALSAGGSIQRKVKDRPDDLNYVRIPNSIPIYEAYHYELAGFYFNGEDLRLMKGGRWGQLSVLNELAFPVASGDYLLGYRDTEPDEFSFSFPGGSGKFYLDLNQNWVVQSDEDIMVELHASPFLDVPFKLPLTTIVNSTDPGSPYGQNWRTDYGTSQTFSGFTITDSKGIKYIYGGDEKYIEYSIDFVNQDRDFWIADSWQLQKIIHPNGETVDFDYKRTAFTDQFAEYLHWNIDTKYNNTNTSIFNFLGQIACGGNKSGFQATFSGRLVAPVYLTSITGSSKKLVLHSSENSRSRHSATFGIPTAEVKNVYRNIVKYYYDNLDHTLPTGKRRAEIEDAINGTNEFPYYSNLLSFQYLIQYYQEKATPVHTAGNMPYNHRSSDFGFFYGRYLYDERLDRIEVFNKISYEVDGFPSEVPETVQTDESLIQNIVLEYEPCENSDNRYNLSKVMFKNFVGQNTDQYILEYFPFDGTSYYFNGRIDHWGFYTNNSIYNVQINDLRYNHAKYFNARSPSLAHTKMNVLKSIMYPTGGKTEFEYELNHAYFAVPKYRTDSLTVFNNHVGGLRVKSMTFYPLNGNSLTKNYYYVKNYNTAFPQRSSGVLAHMTQYLFQDFKTKAAEGSIYVTKTVFSNNSFIPGGSASQGSHIGYSEVVEVNPDGSYIKHYFTNFDNGHKDEEELALIADLSPYNPYTSTEQQRGKEYKTNTSITIKSQLKL